MNMLTDPDLLYLADMRRYAIEAYDLVANIDREEYDRDMTRQYALRYLLTIVGEAASKVSKPLKAAYPQIPWPRITGMRHELVHGYTQVSSSIVWDTARDDLLPLIAELNQIAP
jgi:uncharacterized protein with HEPN domain